MGLHVIPEQEVAFRQITSVIEASQQIVICAHTSPDGDAIGSGLALGMIIEAKWPHKQVTNLLADDAPVPRIYGFLPGSSKMIPASRHAGSPDLFTGNLFGKRLGKTQKNSIRQSGRNGFFL